MLDEAGAGSPADLKPEPQECAACGRDGLQPHLRVATATAETELIPSTSEFGAAQSDIVRCSRCGHMQLERFPAEIDLADAYAVAESADYLEEEMGQRATAAGILESIQRYRRPGALLDLGCWVGFFASEAKRRGWEPIGVEPSEFASAYAREQLGLDVRTAGLLEAELSPAAFDAVFLGDVIEHIPDAAGALDRIAELLKPDGILALALPDAGSRVARVMRGRWWSVIPTHVHYFTRLSMRTLLRRGGWETLEVVSAPKTFTVRYYLRRVGGYHEGTARALVRAAERARIADRLWSLDFRDRMLVIARPVSPAD